MRIATALVFTALVCAAQAQLFPDLSGFGQSVRDRISELRKTIDERLEQAEDRLQSSYKQARERVESGYKRLEEAAENASNRVKEAVDNAQENLQKQVDQLTESSEAQGADLTECKALVQSFRSAGDAMVNSNVKCVTDKVQQGKNITEDVFNKGQESVDVITGIRTQSNKCVEKVEGIAEQISAATCLVSVGARASWALMTKIPAVTRDFAEANVMMYTLIPALSYCSTRNSILSFVEQGSTVAADVRKCVADRISASQSTDKTEVPEVPEVPTTSNPTTQGTVKTEAPEVPEVPTTSSPTTHGTVKTEAPEFPEVPEEPTDSIYTTTPSGVSLPGFEEVPQN